MNNPCQCDFCKWRRKEITDLEFCQKKIDYLKTILDDLSVISTKEDLNDTQEDWARKNIFFHIADEIDCLFEIQNEDCDRPEVSLLFKSLGGDDLINEIKNITSNK